MIRSIQSELPLLPADLIGLLIETFAVGRLLLSRVYLLYSLFLFESRPASNGAEVATGIRHTLAYSISSI